MVHHQFFNSIKLGLLAWLNSVEVSPAGNTFLVSVTKRDVPNNQLLDEFYVLSATGEQIHQKNGSSPVFSPDGKHIAFEDNGALYIYHLETKESRKLTAIYNSEYFMGHMAEKNFVWSPDSKSIAFISTDPYTSSSDTPPQQVIGRLLYKTKGGRGRDKFDDERLSHIWIVPLEIPEPFCLTSGDFNEHSISWSPDGNHIAFICDRSGNPDRTHNNDLLTINVNTKEIRTVVTGTGTRFKPKWSPHSDRIAFLADESVFTSKDSPAPDVHVYCVNRDGNELRCVTASLDRRTDNIKWSSAGDKIYFTAGNHGSTSLYSVDISGTAIEKVIQGSFQLKDYSIDDKNNHVAFIKNTINTPDELYVSGLDHQQCRRITQFNHPVTNTTALADAETFWFNAQDNTAIQGWLMKPAVLETSAQFPLVLVIHGGPHNMYGYEFDEKMQWLAAEGYGVVFFNPRGSSGYGQEFTNGNLLNWGGKDY
ncbi:MAG TPA: DPP IV N-terminal domain-containing protein, partial [Flavitalea sp.]|nr:DPP IV N-terminal domain-containing protein [Flavitalea sp.]